MATWIHYRKARPQLLLTDHRGTHNGDPLRVSFSNVAVKRGVKHLDGRAISGRSLSGGYYSSTGPAHLAQVTDSGHTGL
jgi:hypothetical protein